MLQALSGVLIARSVSPASFGYGMLVVSIYAVTSSVVLQGANGPLVVRSTISRRFLRRTCAVNAGLGVLCSLGLVLVAYFWDFAAPTRTGMFVIAAGSLVLGVGGAGRFLAARTLNFKRLAAGEITGTVLGTSCAVALARATADASVALPLQVVAVDIVGLLTVSVLIFRPRVELPTSGTVKEAGAGYAIQTASNQFFSIGSRNLPNWIIAAVLGSSLLGLYSLAYRLMMLPIQNVAMVLGRVLIPRLRRMGGDLAAIDREVLALLAAITIVVGPLTGAILPQLGVLIDVAFGARWHAAAAPTAFLLLAVFPQCSSTISSSILASRGFASDQLRLTFAQLSTAVVFTVLGTFWGIDGVAASVAVGLIALAVYAVHLVTRRTGISAQAYLVCLRLYLVAALTAAAVSGLAAQLFSPTLAGAVAATAAGFALSLVVVWTVLRGATREGMLFWARMLGYHGRKPVGAEVAAEGQAEVEKA